jgi:hypothetical protein
VQVCGTRNFKGAGPGDHATVFEGVFHGAEPVADSVLELGYGVGVGTLDDEGDGFGGRDVFDVGVFFFAEGLFVD